MYWTKVIVKHSFSYLFLMFQEKCAVNCALFIETSCITRHWLFPLGKISLPGNIAIMVNNRCTLLTKLASTIISWWLKSACRYRLVQMCRASSDRTEVGIWLKAESLLQIKNKQTSKCHHQWQQKLRWQQKWHIWGFKIITYSAVNGRHLTYVGIFGCGVKP